jgi:hypothetical protein
MALASKIDLHTTKRSFCQKSAIAFTKIHAHREAPKIFRPPKTKNFFYVSMGDAAEKLKLRIKLFILCTHTMVSDFTSFHPHESRGEIPFLIDKILNYFAGFPGQILG